MYRRYRRRRARRQSLLQSRFLRTAASIVVVGLLLLFTARWLIGQLGWIEATQAAPADLSNDGRGQIDVQLEQDQWQQANANIKLYASDSVRTDAQGTARLLLADGTIVRLGPSSQLTLLESDSTTSKKHLSIMLDTGQAWILTPLTEQTIEPSIRFVANKQLSASLPLATEARLTESGLQVFSAAGQGTAVSLTDTEASLIVGEGQQLMLGQTDVLPSDLYSLRQPITNYVPNDFVATSRTLAKDRLAVVADEGTTSVAPSATLAVTTPVSESVVDSSTVVVEGTVSSDVALVRVNGYRASLNDVENTFSIELTLPDEDAVRITTEALNEAGEVLEQDVRSISRNRTAPEAPTIISPVAAGETYRTQLKRLEIVGTAPPGAVGIRVNDYRLQLFKPGDTEWRYLASTDLDNYQDGTNEFVVTAINAAGIVSEPAMFTIILGEDPIEEPTDIEETEVEASTDLPNNVPLKPGTLRMVNPSPDSPFTTSVNDHLLEGMAPLGTTGLYVNGYKLKLFEPNQEYYNYIASVELGTLKEGRNRYQIVARDASGQILDELEYFIVYRSE